LRTGLDTYTIVGMYTEEEAQPTLQGMIDSHFHLLEIRKRGIDPQQLLQGLFARGFAGGMDIGLDGADLEVRAGLLSPWPSIKLATGVGPWGADGDTAIEEVAERFKAATQVGIIDCVGEIGLDNYWKYGTPDRQRALFIAQLEMAEAWRKPVCIHSREADSELMAILANREFPQSGILHCFSSSWEVAQTALAKGLYISFAGPITYRKNSVLREMLAKIPQDRLLLETDSPYLAPEPFRGKANTPDLIPWICQKAAQVRNLALPQLNDIVRTNFETLFHSCGTCGPTAG